MEGNRLCLDASINVLPSNIIETILCLVPFKEAARTSILSREWRYHWTKIPKVEFETSQATRKLLYSINQAMSMHEGPIHEFSLSTYAPGLCVEMDRIIENLSRNNKNTVKKLTLETSSEYWLPESFFLLHKLTDMYLYRCRIDVHEPTTFSGSGFGSLANLNMEGVYITKKMLIRFLSGCPSLKTAILNPDIGRLPPAAIDDSTTIIELFECLRVVENLSIHLRMLEHFAPDGVPKKLPAALVHLKYLCIRNSRCSVYKYIFPCFAFLLRSCPNLEKLKLKLFWNLRPEISDTLKNYYSDMWLEHLNELEIELWAPTRFGLGFLRLILAKSPALKKVKILISNMVPKDQELKISRFLLRTPRVSSSLVEEEIIVQTGAKLDTSPFNRGL